MDNIATNIELLYNRAKEYTDAHIELLRLTLIDKTADVISSIIVRLTLLIVVVMFTLFVNIALSLYIGTFLGQEYLGFLIVSGFYLILALLIVCFGSRFIKIPITNLVIAKLLKSKGDLLTSNNSNNENL